jgi:sulfatase maturation enzyme AslB (radical SAM superfamily)
MQEELVNKFDSQQTTSPSTISNFAQQHNITFETVANVTEERYSRPKKSLHYLAKHNDQISE